MCCCCKTFIEYAEILEYAEFIGDANWNSSPHICKINYGCSLVNLSEYLSELGQTRLPTAHVIDRDLKVCTLQFFPQVWPKNQLLDKWLIRIKEKGKIVVIEYFLHFCNGNLIYRSWYIVGFINLPKIIKINWIPTKLRIKRKC